MEYKYAGVRKRLLFKGGFITFFINDIHLNDIYYQGKKPWLANSGLAKQYFAKPILIDLPAILDNELQQHPQIGSIEMALKCVRQKNFTGKLRMILTALRSAESAWLNQIL
jgi:hypothetical protein